MNKLSPVKIIVKTPEGRVLPTASDVKIYLGEEFLGNITDVSFSATIGGTPKLSLTSLVTEIELEVLQKNTDFNFILKKP